VAILCTYWDRTSWNACIQTSQYLKLYTSLSAITERNLFALEVLGFASRKGGDNRPCVRTHRYLCVSVVQTVVKRQSCDPWDATNHTIKYSPVHHFHIQECVLFGWQNIFRPPFIDLIDVLQFSRWSDYIRKSELISFNRVICSRFSAVVLHCMQLATLYT